MFITELRKMRKGKHKKKSSMGLARVARLRLDTQDVPLPSEEHRILKSRMNVGLAGWLPTDKGCNPKQSKHGGLILQGLSRPPQRPFPISEVGCVCEQTSKTNHR